MSLTNNKYPHIVHIINDKETKIGGTMRLGDFSGEIKKLYYFLLYPTPILFDDYKI